jgi:signal transduction histidine kinase/uncharacterized protein YigA (DUF484 family)
MAIDRELQTLLDRTVEAARELGWNRVVLALRDEAARSDADLPGDNSLIVPLQADGEELGWLAVGDPADRQRPTLAQTRLLEVFADQAALTIQQARLYQRARDQMARQAVLNELVRTISQHLEMVDLFPAIARQLRQALSFRRASIVLREGQRPQARIFVQDERDETQTPTSLETIAFSRIIERAQPYRMVSDLFASAESGDEADLAAQGLRSYACLPLTMWGRVIGVLSLAAEDPATFQAKDGDFLLQIAEHVGGAVWNALLHEIEQSRRHAADALAQLSKIVNSTLELDEVLERALEQLARVITYDTSTILLVEGDNLKITACRGFANPESLIGAVFRMEEDNISHRVMRSQQARVVGDAQALPEWGHHRDDLEGYQNIHAWIGAPLVVRDQSIGLLVVDNFEPDVYTEEDGELVAAFATQIAIAIQNARLYQATQEQLDKLAAILTDASDAVIVVNETGRIWLLNPAARRDLKLQREKAVGWFLSELGLPELTAAFEKAKAFQGPMMSEIAGPEGASFHASIAPVRDVGWVIVMQDITPLKELDRLRTEWVAAVSHDLKNPIQVVQLGAALLEMDGSLNELQLERVSMIQRGAEQLQGLVANVLDLARLEAGPTLRFTPLNPQEVVKASLVEVIPLASRKQQALIEDTAPDLPPIRGDGTLLQRALVNLLSNAIKYTPVGGMITLRAAGNGENVRFEVIDTGLGIPAEALPHVFDRFYRAHGSDAEGTGLGLSIVKSIVEKHNGSIGVSSAVGEGSAFAILLPIDQSR